MESTRGDLIGDLWGDLRGDFLDSGVSMMITESLLPREGTPKSSLPEESTRGLASATDAVSLLDLLREDEIKGDLLLDFFVGDFAFGDFFRGDFTLGDFDLGDFFLGDFFLGELFLGDLFLGDLFLGDLVLGDLPLEDFVLGDFALGDLALGDFFLGDLCFLVSAFMSGEVLVDKFRLRADSACGDLSRLRLWDKLPAGDLLRE